MKSETVPTEIPPFSRGFSRPRFSRPWFLSSALPLSELLSSAVLPSALLSSAVLPSALLPSALLSSVLSLVHASPVRGFSRIPLGMRRMSRCTDGHAKPRQEREPQQSIYAAALPPFFPPVLPAQPFTGPPYVCFPPTEASELSASTPLHPDKLLLLPALPQCEEADCTLQHARFGWERRS